MVDQHLVQAAQRIGRCRITNADHNGIHLAEGRIALDADDRPGRREAGDVRSLSNWPIGPLHHVPENLVDREDLGVARELQLIERTEPDVHRVQVDHLAVVFDVRLPELIGARCRRRAGRQWLHVFVVVIRLIRADSNEDLRLAAGCLSIERR